MYDNRPRTVATFHSSCIMHGAYMYSVCRGAVICADHRTFCLRKTCFKCDIIRVQYKCKCVHILCVLIMHLGSVYGTCKVQNQANLLPTYFFFNLSTNRWPYMFILKSSLDHNCQKKQCLTTASSQINLLSPIYFYLTNFIPYYYIHIYCLLIYTKLKKLDWPEHACVQCWRRRSIPTLYLKKHSS